MSKMALDTINGDTGTTGQSAPVVKKQLLNCVFCCSEINGEGTRYTFQNQGLLELLGEELTVGVALNLKQTGGNNSPFIGFPSCKMCHSLYNTSLMDLYLRYEGVKSQMLIIFKEYQDKVIQSHKILETQKENGAGGGCGIKVSFKSEDNPSLEDHCQLLRNALLGSLAQEQVQGSFDSGSVTGIEEAKSSSVDADGVDRRAVAVAVNGSTAGPFEATPQSQDLLGNFLQENLQFEINASSNNNCTGAVETSSKDTTTSAEIISQPQNTQELRCTALPEMKKRPASYCKLDNTCQIEDPPPKKKARLSDDIIDKAFQAMKDAVKAEKTEITDVYELEAGEILSDISDNEDATSTPQSQVSLSSDARSIDTNLNVSNPLYNSQSPNPHEVRIRTDIFESFLLSPVAETHQGRNENLIKDQASCRNKRLMVQVPLQTVQISRIQPLLPSESHFSRLSTTTSTSSSSSSSATLAGRSISSKSKQNPLNKPVSTSVLFSCMRCQDCYSDKKQLEAHYVTHASKGPYPCLICDSGADSMSSEGLGRHLTLVHGITPHVDNNSESSGSYSNSIPCVFRCFCGETFPTGKDMRNHTNLKHSKKNSTQRDEQLPTFLERKHCDICPPGQKFLFDESALIQHLYVVHEVNTDSKPFRCHKCHKRFAVRMLFNRHEDFHKVERQKPFSCDVCEERFESVKQSKDHMSSAHGWVSSYECPVCFKPFNSYRSLGKHILWYHPDYKGFLEDRKFNPQFFVHGCFICGKEYSNKSFFTTHLRTHWVENCVAGKDKRMHQGSYDCAVCSFKSYSGVQLEEHLQKAHTGELKCSECSTIFFCQDHLDRHFKGQHSGLLPSKKQYHIETLKPRPYGRKRNRERKRTQFFQTHTCHFTFCAKDFTNWPDLRNHYEKLHPSYYSRT